MQDLFLYQIGSILDRNQGCTIGIIMEMKKLYGDTPTSLGSARLASFLKASRHLRTTRRRTDL